MAEPSESTTKKTSAKKSGAKKTSAKKSSAKKSTAKKTTAKKAPAKKTASKRTAARTEASRNSQSEDRGSSRPSASKAALAGAEQLTDLTGKEFEGIVGVTKSDDGWTVQVEVLEMRRIPATTDVLALYEVEVDTSGDLTGYRRAGRYVRGKAGEEGG